MHYTAFPRFHVSRLNTGLRVLMSLYLLTVLIGLLGTLALYSARSDFSFWGSVLHFQGHEAVPEEILSQMEAEQGGGMLMREPMSWPRVIEILHPHLFSVPLVLMVIAHLFAMTNGPAWVKILSYLGTFGGFLGVFGGMWWATQSMVGVYVIFVAGAFFFAASIWMCIVPIWAMWFGRAATASERKGDAPDLSPDGE